MPIEPMNREDEMSEVKDMGHAGKPESAVVDAQDGAPSPLPFPWQVLVITSNGMHVFAYADERAAVLSYRRLRKAINDEYALKNSKRTSIEVADSLGRATLSTLGIKDVRVTNADMMRADWRAARDVLAEPPTRDGGGTPSTTDSANTPHDQKDLPARATGSEA